MQRMVTRASWLPESVCVREQCGFGILGLALAVVTREGASG